MTARRATLSEIRAPGHHPRQNVAAQLVGAERMPQPGWRASRQDVGLRQRIGKKPGSDHGGEGDDQQQQRTRAAFRIAPGVPQRCQRFAHASRTRGSSSA